MKVMSVLIQPVETLGKGRTFIFPGFGGTRTSYSTRDIFMRFKNMAVVFGANKSGEVALEDAKVFYPPLLVFSTFFLL